MPARTRRIVFVVLFCVGLIGGASLIVRALGEDSSLTAAERALERRDFIAAGKHLEDHLAAHPHDPRAQLLAAQAARRRLDIETARHHLLELERGGTDAEGVKLEHRLLSLQTGNLAEAESLFEDCRRNPDAPETALIIEALVEGTLNRLAPPLQYHDPFLTSEPLPPPLVRARSAINFWLEHQTRTPDRVQGLVWQARASELAGDHPAAIRSLRDALAMDPGHFEARYYFSLFRSPDSPREALVELEPLAEQNPDHRQIHLLRASLYRDLGRLDQAREIVRHFLAQEPSDAALNQVLAWVELDSNHPREAEIALQKVLSRAPDSAAAHHAMSRALRLQGREQEAKPHTQRAEEIEKSTRQRQESRSP